MAINIFKMGRMYSETVFFKNQALSKAALAAGLGVGLLVQRTDWRRCAPRWDARHGEPAQLGWVARGSRGPVQRSRYSLTALRSLVLCCPEFCVPRGDSSGTLQGACPTVSVLAERY